MLKLIRLHGITNNHLHAIGAIAVNSSIMDSVLDVAIWFFLQLNRETGRAITVDMQTGEKINLLTNLAEIRIDHRPTKAAAKKIIDALNSANGKRNDVIHGAWVYYPDENRHEIKRFRGRGKMTVTRKPMPLNLLRASAAEIERATEGLKSFLLTPAAINASPVVPPTES